jgi:hypothetical protein
MDATATTKLEKALTRLGMWGGMRAFASIVVALVGSVLLLVSLVPSAADLFPRASPKIIYVVATGFGLLLGLFGHFAAEAWDRFLFEACYGPSGAWLDAAAKPFHLFPPGAPLKATRGQAVPHLGPKINTGHEIYREAVKLAKRQAERWERIEHPLILSWALRGLLWPSLTVAIVAGIAGIAAWFAGAIAEAPRLLAVAVASLLLQVLLLASYLHFRMAHMLRLYQDVASHHAKRKS